MIENTESKTSQDIHMENESYIEKKVNSLSTYNVYWCQSELRARSQLPTEGVLKNDALCKRQLIRVLKHKKYNPRRLDIFLESSAENSIPLSYIKWFYDDKRAALWLNMILKTYNISSNKILTESDIEIFTHDIVFNRGISISNNKIIETYDHLEISLKNKTLEFLKNTYLRSKVGEKDIKWLTKNSSDKIKLSKSYQYMQKIYDIDNLKRNKEANKIIKKSKEAIDKVGYKQALICTDTIFFESTDSAGRLDHMLASLDYWVFDTHWFATENVRIDEQKIANRGLFIRNMYEAWNAKQKRDRDKLKKKQGIDLTSDNKKNLRYLAKRRGKTQREVLNDLVESAYESADKEARYQEIQQNPSFANRDSFFDKIPQAQPVNLPSKSNEEKSIPEDSVLNESAEELNSKHAVESVRPSIHNQDASFNNIPLAQSSILPSGHSEKEVISEDISSIKGQEELNRSYDTDSAIPSTCDNEKPPTDLTPREEFIFQQKLLFGGNSGKQTEDVADANIDKIRKL